MAPPERGNGRRDARRRPFRCRRSSLRGLLEQRVRERGFSVSAVTLPSRNGLPSRSSLTACGYCSEPSAVQSANELHDARRAHLALRPRPGRRSRRACRRPRTAARSPATWRPPSPPRGTRRHPRSRPHPARQLDRRGIAEEPPERAVPVLGEFLGRLRVVLQLAHRAHPAGLAVEARLDLAERQLLRANRRSGKRHDSSVLTAIDWPSMLSVASVASVTLLHRRPRRRSRRRPSPPPASHPCRPGASPRAQALTLPSLDGGGGIADVHALDRQAGRWRAARRSPAPCRR